MRRLLQIGNAIVQRTDGTWQTDYIMRVLDDEPVPTTPGEAEAFIRKEVNPRPVLKAAADAAVVGLTDPLARAVAATGGVLGLNHAEARAWAAKRNVGPNRQATKHPDQG